MFACCRNAPRTMRPPLDLYGSCQGYRELLQGSTRFTGEPHPSSRYLHTCSVPCRTRTASLLPASAKRRSDSPIPWNGRSFLDLYHSDLEDRPCDLDRSPEPLPGKVNGDYHEGPAVFSPDGANALLHAQQLHGSQTGQGCNEHQPPEALSRHVGQHGQVGRYPRLRPQRRRFSPQDTRP